MRAALLAALCACALCAGPARSAPADFVVEAELLPARVYAGAEATLRLRLLRAPGVPYGVLRPPALGDAAEISPLGPIRRYETRRAGVTYEVHERAHLIVPRRAGRLVVPDAELEGPLRYSESYRRDARAAHAPSAARGPLRVLEVRPPPPGAGEPWLPARRLTLEESWSRDPDALSAGTPVTRTLVLRAEGLAAERLPRLEMAAQPALLAHHDLPELATEVLDSGTVGRRVQRIVLMPLAEGEAGLPALSVRWWDVATDAPRTATLAGRTLRLRAAIVPEVPDEEPSGVSGRAVLRGFAAAIALLSVAVLWWYLRTQPLREARRQLRAACRRNQARAAHDALIEWWKAATPGAPVPLVRRIGDAWDAGARAQLGALDAALYGGGAWDGKAFWRCARPWLRGNAVRRRAPASPPLPSLFRLQARRNSSSSAPQS